MDPGANASPASESWGEGGAQTQRSQPESLRNVEACGFCAGDPIFLGSAKTTNKSLREKCLRLADWVPGEGILRVRHKLQSAPSAALSSASHARLRATVRHNWKGLNLGLVHQSSKQFVK